MPSESQLEVNQLIHELRNRLNNIALNGELARLLLKKGKSETEILSKIDKIVDDTRQTATMVQVWYDQTEIK